jgi:hypothetical protein
MILSMNKKDKIPANPIARPVIMRIMTRMIIGSRIIILVSHTIIPVGVLIGHGIMDVSILRTGIRCGGVLRSMQAMRIIRTAGVIGILIQDMATLIQVLDIHIILVRSQHVTPVTKGEEIISETPVLGDHLCTELRDPERYLTVDLARRAEASILPGHQAREHNKAVLAHCDPLAEALLLLAVHYVEFTDRVCNNRVFVIKAVREVVVGV